MKKIISIILCAITAFSCAGISANAYYYYYSYIIKPSYVSVYNTTDTSLRVTWGWSENADGYILYCKKQGGNFKKIKTIKNKNFYVHQKLSYGKKYTYKVKAYGKINGKKKYSSYSPKASKKVVEPLTTRSAYIYSVTPIDTDTFKISWGGMTRASGYELYYKTSSTSFKKLATLSGKNKITYTHKNLTAGTKYFYKVRAYRNTSSGKRYSKYSVQLGKKCTNYLVDLYNAYNYNSGGTEFFKGGNTFKIAGDNYGNGFVLGNDYGSFYGDDYVFYNLKGKYKYITMTIGILDGGYYNSKFSVYSDDALVGSFELKTNSLPQTVKVNIDNANKLEFRKNEREGRDIGIAEIKLYK
ncbi:MAG: fibronectin type III domain-containing protein [Ruminococcus sp.]|nr:fibronectin type III domain-containing protein [Ruminococcus sp.]